jgi:hypothetical protein
VRSAHVGPVRLRPGELAGQTICPAHWKGGDVMESPVVGTVGTLTRDHIRAMREATSVGFHSHHPQAGGGAITLTRVVKSRGMWLGDSSQQSCSVAVSSYVRGKHGDGMAATMDNSRCVAVIASAQYTDVWRTVVELVKPGDVISLSWGADIESNGYVRRSTVTERCPESNDSGMGQRLHADSLTICVKRGNKNLHFLMDVCICPDNTARMVRRA